MSMLAEKRRKSRYVLNPTRKPLWASDSSGIKFGKELMEKMGWSTGKGLGAKEQGIQEPLRVSFKNDSKGIGFKENDTKWIEYQDEFNSLLNELSNSTGNSTAKESESNGVMSLEEKSKHSKVRVHYQKFTRGKDISKYSENDLSCILGTSKTKKAEEPKVEETPTESNTYTTNFGVTTINSGSLTDYFKKKWVVNKSKNINSNEETTENGINIEEEVSEEGIKEKKSKKRHRESDEELNDENAENIEVKKHKKKRRKKDPEEECLGKEEMKLGNNEGNLQNKEVENSPENVNYDCSEVVNQTKNKKKKKREREQLEEAEPSAAELNVQTEIEMKKKHKKKKKEVEENCSDKNEVEINGDVEEPQNERLKEDSKKKKKRKKEKNEESENNNEIEINGNCTLEELDNVKEVIVIKENSEKKKKKKKEKEKELQDGLKKNGQTEVEDGEELKNDVEEEPTKKKKKKKDKEREKSKKETFESGDCCSIEEDEKKLEVVAKKEKKKKTKENVEGDSTQLESVEVELENQTSAKKKKKKNKNIEKTEEEKKEEEMNKTHEEEEDSIKKKKNENKKEENTNKLGKETFIHTHKTELYKMKKPMVEGMRTFSSGRVVEMFCGAQMEQFKGSNVLKIPGYGFTKHIKSNLER